MSGKTEPTEVMILIKYDRRGVATHPKWHSRTVASAFPIGCYHVCPKFLTERPRLRSSKYGDIYFFYKFL